MKAQAESISSVALKITVEVEPQEFKKEEAAAVKQLTRTVQIPGFRKGKAPESAIKKFFGDRVRSEALSMVIESSYGQALRDMKIWPVDDPEIKVEKFEEDGSMTYTAEVEVRPEVVAAGYTDLELKREASVVDDAAVEARLEGLRQQCSTFEPAEEGYKAAMGDMAVVDFTGSLDGVPFDGGAAKGHTLMLGSGRMIPGFEEGVVGAGLGEEVNVSVTFPEQYHADHLAGKPAEFCIRINELKRRVVPELSDELAKQAANLETLDELKVRVREAVEAETANRIDRDFRNAIITKLLAANEFEVPKSLVRKQTEHSLDRMRQDLSARGIDPEAWGIGNPQFLAEAEKAALRSVRWAFLSDAIARAENIEVTAEELDQRIRDIAAADGRPYASIKAFFDQEGNSESLKTSLREQKTIEFIIAAAKVEEVTAEDWAAWAES